MAVPSEPKPKETTITFTNPFGQKFVVKMTGPTDSILSATQIFPDGSKYPLERRSVVED